MASAGAAKMHRQRRIAMCSPQRLFNPAYPHIHMHATARVSGCDRPGVLWLKLSVGIDYGC
jgi:hypothetical protein